MYSHFFLFYMYKSLSRKYIIDDIWKSAILHFTSALKCLAFTIFFYGKPLSNIINFKDQNNSKNSEKNGLQPSVQFI